MPGSVAAHCSKNRQNGGFAGVEVQGAGGAGRSGEYWTSVCVLVSLVSGLMSMVEYTW